MYLFFSLIGTCLHNVNSMRTGKSGCSRLPFLASIINKIPNTFHDSVPKASVIISPILFAISSVFLPLSPTLADTMENGNAIMVAAGDHSLALSSFVSPNAYQFIFSPTFLLTSSETLDELYLELALRVLYIFLYVGFCVKAITQFFSSEIRGLDTSVVKLQIGLDAENWSDRDTKDMSQKLSDFPREKRGQQLSEAAVTLLRKQADWNSATLDNRIYISFSDAELEYHRLSVVERSKLQRVAKKGNIQFDSSLFNNSSDDVKQWGLQSLEKLLGWSKPSSPPPQTMTMSRSKSIGGSEVVVVTLLALIRGKSTTSRPFFSSLLGREGDTRTTAEVRRSLTALASEALLDGSSNLQLAEILCCPMAGAESKALSPEDTVLLYPELWTM